MSRKTMAGVAIALCAGMFAQSPARADGAGPALIVGNATYTAFPGLTGCGRSANAVAAALRALKFDVTDREDASTGGIDAGIAEFSQHVAGGKGAAFIYVCGYATDFNTRTFLLPTTARIGRPSDVMTQGVLAKSLLATIGHDPDTVGVVVFDMIPQPDGPPKIDLDALAGSAVPPGVGVIAASQSAVTDAPTPLATALVAALAGPKVTTEDLLNQVQAKLADSRVSVASVHAPLKTGFLAGAPPPAPKPAPVVAAPAPAPAVAPTPAPAPVVVPVPVAAPPAPPPAPVPAPVPTVQMPEEAQMTDPERRKVQSALARLGYYDNPIDAVFGPETRAAIRRYQHEIGAETTGRLTADQASRLVSTR